MGQTATAAVLRKRDEPFCLEEIQLPELGHGQVLVEIKAAGLCHSDLVLREGYLAGAWPILLGHEGAGIVREVGPGAVGVEVGDHVVLSFDSCGSCLNCLDGHPAYCDTFGARNLTGTSLGVEAQPTDRSGATVAGRWFGQSSFATHAVSTARNFVVIEKDIPLELAAPLGCGFLTGAGTVHNVLHTGPGDSIVVLGVGSVGMGALSAAVSAGASRVVAVDLQQTRLELARELGATHVIGKDASDDLTDAIAATGGPVKGVFDTTGHPGVIRAAVDSLAPRGICAIAGAQRHDLVFGPLSVKNGRVVTAVYEGDAVPRIEIPRLVSLWRQGRLPLERMITTYPLSEIDAAEKDMLAAAVLKPVLIP